MPMRTIVVAAVLGFVLAGVPTWATAEEKLEGKVIRTNLTKCQPRPMGGGCEGTLTLETKVDGKARQVPIKVLADTIIKKGKEPVFLPATQGNAVVVTYANEKDQKIAKSIDVVVMGGR